MIPNSTTIKTKRTLAKALPLLKFINKMQTVNMATAKKKVPRAIVSVDPKGKVRLEERVGSR